MEKKLSHSKKIFGIIPARGNSKGIKIKTKINGKPLIYYTIKRAKSKLIWFNWKYR